ncbi:MAG: leucine-rich repeat domain-containing protein, partial [Coriobacteriaceae bacterium]|nr:leucine-rich repeat domain-containing protein [Coriobacteriaceae bacterium]
MNTTTAFRNLAMAVAAMAVLLVAMLALAPSAWAASQYAVVKSDGYLHQTDSNCQADYGVAWGQTENECRNALNEVTTLFIDGNTTSIATVKVKWKSGSTYKDQVITLSGNRGEMGTHNLHLIFFLKPSGGGQNRLSQMQDWYQFANLKSLVGVAGLENTSLRSIPNGCFAGCDNLSMFGGTSCMPNVTTIGSAAFRDCDSLKSITIPASVTYIGSGPMNDGAFRGCDSL